MSEEFVLKIQSDDLVARTRPQKGPPQMADAAPAVEDRTVGRREAAHDERKHHVFPVGYDGTRVHVHFSRVMLRFPFGRQPVVAVPRAVGEMRYPIDDGILGLAFAAAAFPVAQCNGPAATRTGHERFEQLVHWANGIATDARRR